VRPPVANLDVLVLVASIADPAPNTLIMVKMIARAEDLGIEPVLVINKIDLEDAAWLEEAYRLAGIPVFVLSAAGCCQHAAAAGVFIRKGIGFYRKFRRRQDQPAQRDRSAAGFGDRRNEQKAWAWAAYHPHGGFV